MTKIFTIVLALTILGLNCALAQTEVDERAMISFHKGLGFNAPDSTFGLNIRLRVQSRALFNFDEQFNTEDIEGRISRLRLRFDGYILSEKLTYYLQLSFSRGDQDWDNTHIPNVVRDAMVYYRFNPKIYIGFGQGKLPGNRERIISSGQQQFYDRSVVNANYTLDRDFGLFGYYNNNAGGIHFNIKGAISTGDGRNQLKTDNGLMYTGRLEVLPLGKFKKDGDFSEGDLEFEATPKLSIAGGYSVNQKAKRTRGTIGTEIYESRDLSTFFADMVLKYKGWALSSEFINRSSPQSAFTFNPEDSTQMAWVTKGHGLNTQLSYCLPNYWEFALRYAYSEPDAELRQLTMRDNYYIVGVNKYIRKHLTKVQASFGYRSQESYNSSISGKNNFILVFQVELGI